MCPCSLSLPSRVDVDPDPAFRPLTPAHVPGRWHGFRNACLHGRMFLSAMRHREPREALVHAGRMVAAALSAGIARLHAGGVHGSALRRIAIPLVMQLAIAAAHRQ